MRLEKSRKQDAVEKIARNLVIYLSVYQTDQYEYGTERKASFKEFTTVSDRYFPLDMPDDEKIIAKKFKKIKFYKTILLTAYSEMGKGAYLVCGTCKASPDPGSANISTRKTLHKLNAISKEYPIDKSPYVAVFCGGMTAGENAVVFRAGEVEFEGHMFPAPKC